MHCVIDIQNWILNFMKFRISVQDQRPLLSFVFDFHRKVDDIFNCPLLRVHSHSINCCFLKYIIALALIHYYLNFLHQINKFTILLLILLLYIIGHDWLSSAGNNWLSPYDWRFRWLSFKLANIIKCILYLSYRFSLIL